MILNQECAPDRRLATSELALPQAVADNCARRSASAAVITRSMQTAPKRRHAENREGFAAHPHGANGPGLRAATEAEDIIAHANTPDKAC